MAKSRFRGELAVGACGLFIVAAFSAYLVYAYYDQTDRIENPRLPPPKEVTEEQARAYCGSCHMYPSPKSFPKDKWDREVTLAYDFARLAGRLGGAPDFHGMQKYYRDNAPEALPFTDPPSLCAAPAVRFEKSEHTPEGADPAAVTSGVRMIQWEPNGPWEIVACHMREDRITATRIDGGKSISRVLAERPPTPKKKDVDPDPPMDDPNVDAKQPSKNDPAGEPKIPRPKLGMGPPKGNFGGRPAAEFRAPAKVEPIDLDGDGKTDLVAAMLGSMVPTDDRCGSVMWLRNDGTGSFIRKTLLEGVGRVSDVRPIDVDKDGRMDLIVAVFGWRTVGEIVLLHNVSKNARDPEFTAYRLDSRKGAIHVIPCDLNKDGNQDFVTVFSQEHEEVVAFINDGKGQFAMHTLFQADHPAYGCSGIDVADIDADGDLDVILSHGDTLDPPPLLRTEHGVTILQNDGDLKFTTKPLSTQYGAMRAVAGDFDGDGRMDIVAVSYLGLSEFPTRQTIKAASVVLYRRKDDATYEVQVLETGNCDHISLTTATLPGTKNPSLIIGNGCFTDKDRRLPAFLVWKNLGSGKGN